MVIQEINPEFIPGAKIKILGTGKLTKKLVVENCKTSKSAMDAIIKAGGSVK